MDCTKNLDPEKLGQSLDEVIAESRSHVERLDAAVFRDYGIDEYTDFRFCQDGSLLILSTPRLQLSPQQIIVLRGIEAEKLNPVTVWRRSKRYEQLRELGLMLPPGATPSQRASRSRAISRMRDQGLISNRYKLTLTEQGERLCNLLGQIVPPVNFSTIFYKLTGREFSSPVNNVKAFSVVNRAAKVGTR